MGQRFTTAAMARGGWGFGTHGFHSVIPRARGRNELGILRFETAKGQPARAWEPPKPS